ncbi:MAG: hypothetical protein mread185_000064 [Mycoplasmataceae bacterium]|nr:MAG: hypothetical protein mread185_000064 [Mycoplasmataceae bacterium]
MFTFNLKNIFTLGLMKISNFVDIIYLIPFCFIFNYKTKKIIQPVIKKSQLPYLRYVMINSHKINVHWLKSICSKSKCW